MKRILLMLAALVSASVLIAGVALAATRITCEPGSTLQNPCSGTDGDDRITGTGGRDIIRAKGSADFVRGLAGGDNIHGEEGNDNLRGDEHQDSIEGEAGNDTLIGGAGPDSLGGGTGRDGLYGGAGSDAIGANDPDDEARDEAYGAGGPDTIGSEDGHRDYVNCGDSPQDIAYVDEGLDEVVGCEYINPVIKDASVSKDTDTSVSEQNPAP